MVHTKRIPLLLAFLYPLLATCSSLVPLIGWSNSDAFKSLKGSQFSGANEFIYDAMLDGMDMVVIFKTPELSFDSLAKYGGIFGGKNPTMASLQAELQGSKSSAWVGVGGSVASDLVKTLSFVMGTKPHVITGADGVTSQHKLVLVELLPSSGANGFSEQDGVIAEVMSALHSLSESLSYAAIYTSSHTHLPRPSYEQQEVRRRRYADDTLMRIPRAVNQESASDVPMCAALYGNSSSDAPPCMLFCITNTNTTRINSTLEEEMDEDVPNANITNLEFVGGSCTEGSETCGGGANSTACLIVSGEVNSTETGELEPILFKFIFPFGACKDVEGGWDNITCGFWTMQLYIDDVLYTRATEERKIFSDFLVPNGTSYACGNNRLNVFEPNNSNITDGYQFSGIQVQLFSGITFNREMQPVFGSAFHCQGYLSTVPLMGLTVIIILVLILYCSVVFLFSIKTGDRCDDPRGETISVENLH